MCLVSWDLLCTNTLFRGLHTATKQSVISTLNVTETSNDSAKLILKQKETIENAAPFSELKNYQKGNLGEIITDIGIEDQLNTTRVGDRITDINKGGHHGIDGVYELKSKPPEYYIVEAKHTKNMPRLSKTKNGYKQMSEAWFDDGVDTYRDRFLQYAKGDKKIADKIREAYRKGETIQLLSHVKSDGTVDLYKIDKMGEIGKKFEP